MKDALGHGSNPRGAHSAGVDQIGKVVVGNDVRDAHGGEIYGSIYATHALTGKQVGAIDYGAQRTPRGHEVSIQMIRVAPEFQGHGIAGQMMDHLNTEFSGANGYKPTIHWGGTTPEGTAFRKAYYRSRRSQ